MVAAGPTGFIRACHQLTPEAIRPRLAHKVPPSLVKGSGCADSSAASVAGGSIHDYARSDATILHLPFDCGCQPYQVPNTFLQVVVDIDSRIIYR